MQTLFFNGTIITMENEKTVDSLLIENDVIRSVGTLANVEALAAPDVQRVDLCGHTLLPAFIDAHSHFILAVQAFTQASMSAARNFNDIVEIIRGYIEENHIKPGVWVRAIGYDNNFLEENAHPDAAILDKAAPYNPVVLTHVSGHMGAFNTCALKLLEPPEREDAIQGGRIAVKDGKPTGYMEEAAFREFRNKVPAPGIQDIVNAFPKAQELYLKNGITFAQEGEWQKEWLCQMVPVYQQVLSSGNLKLDIVGYPWVNAYETVEQAFENINNSHFRLGGYKMILDGSPQARTAWMRTPYLDSDDFCGYGRLDDDTVYANICKAAKDERQILAHCNGDAAIEQYISMAEKAIANGYNVAKIRPVIIHAQFLGKDQVARAERAGFMASFFVAHVYHWGDIHVKNFGYERASYMSPTFSALNQGLKFTFHQDTPIIPPNMLETIWCAVNRISKKGKVIGPEERISIYEALRAVTINAAYQYFEEDIRGSLKPGKKADIIILNQNPLELPEAIKDIKVMATYKDGKCIWKI